jgi:16S rRNA (uracil1498-N3)-methyltransferase
VTGGAGPASVGAAAHVFVERLDDILVIQGDAGHHLQRARRIRSGETVTGADGYGRWRRYDVSGSERGAVHLEARSGIEHEPTLTPRLTVAFALTKGERPELVTQKLTELGVDRIMVIAAARSVVRWDDDKAAAAIDRLRKIAREAASQARRARLPLVEGPLTPADLGARDGLLVAAWGGSTVDQVPMPGAGEWVVLVGPEGGVTAEELAAVAPAPELGIGPFVLRAETAAIAAAAALAGRRVRPKG